MKSVDQLRNPLCGVARQLSVATEVSTTRDTSLLIFFVALIP